MTSILPRYRLTLSLTPSGGNILATATLKDNQTGLTVASINNWSSATPTTWYNVTAKRFGMGAVKAGTTTFDNFVGQY